MPSLLTAMPATGRGAFQHSDFIKYASTLKKAWQCKWPYGLYRGSV